MSSPVTDAESDASADQAPQPRLFRNSGFLNFLLARIVAVCATQIQAVVVAWQVYDLTRSPMALAYVGLAQFLPMLVLLPVAGDLIDRFNRKHVLMLAWGAGSLCSAALWWLSGHGHAGVNGIYAVLVAYGVTRAFSGPAMQSLLPQVVPREQLPQAIAANSMIMRGAAIGGPLLGGTLYALGSGKLTYAVCFAGLALGALLMGRVPMRPMQHTAVGSEGAASNSLRAFFHRFAEGIRFIRSRPIVLGTISLDLFAVLLGGVVALLPIYAKEVLHVGPTGLGMLRSAMAVGEIAAGVVLSTRPFQTKVGTRMLTAVAVFGVANLVFALSHWFWLSFIALAVAGAADMVSVYVRGALVQFATPDDMRGRVNAVNMLFIGSSNELGEFRAGTSAAGLGTVPAAVTGALCTLGVVALWAWWFPALRRVNRFAEATDGGVSAAHTRPG